MTTVVGGPGRVRPGEFRPGHCYRRPGRGQLGLFSGGTSLVIDRLQQAGHIRRARDHPTDNRVVHLRYTEQGMATGLALFGSLGDRANSILDQFSPDELAIIRTFISAMADSMRDQLGDLETGSAS